MKFKIYNDLQDPFYERFIKFLLKNTSTLFYQSPKFHSLLIEHLDAEINYFIWEEEDILLASIPILIKRSQKHGNVANSLPYYGSNGSFVFNSEIEENIQNKIRKQFIDEFDTFCNLNGIVAYTIVTNPFQQSDSEFFNSKLEFTHKDERIGQVTSIPEFSENIENDLLNVFSDPRPRNIRRARKAGITVEKRWDNDAIKFLFETHKQNIENIGGKAKSENFFKAVPRYFNEDEYCIFIASIDEKPISALLVFYFNETVEYFTPATLHEYRNDQPSALIIFEALINASKLGYKNWNWGGTWHTQKGVYDFKKKWGAIDMRYKYFINVRNKSWMLLDDKKELIEAFPNFYLFPY